jgi:hypothetical protein
MNTSETIIELATALSAAQGEIQDASKDAEGYGYKYADLAQILQILRPVFAKHGLSVVQLPHNQDGGIAVTTRLCHKSGEWIEETLVMPAEKSKQLSLAQDIGKIITYARRYMLSAVAGITQEDPDAAKKGETEVVPMPKKPVFVKETEQIESCASLDELQEVWTALPVAAKKSLATVKERMKADLA